MIMATVKEEIAKRQKEVWRLEEEIAELRKLPPNQTAPCTWLRNCEDLDSKVVSVLNRSHIFTVEDLICKNENQLNRMHQIGPKSIATIKRWLSKHGLNLRDF